MSIGHTDPCIPDLGGGTSAPYDAAPGWGISGASVRPLSQSSIRRIRRGLHHLIALQKVAEVPGLVIPVLYFAESGGSENEVLMPLSIFTDYLVSHSAMSITWMLTRARGIGLLYDYLRQRRAYFQAKASEDLVSVHRLALAEFQVHLTRGTVVSGPSGLVDHTGLYWLPRSSPDGAINLCRGVHDFLVWLHDGGYGDRLGKSTADEREIPKNGREAIRFLYVARYRKEVSFLSHIKAERQQRRPINSFNIAGRDTRSFDAQDTFQFPRQYLAPLFLEGFVSRPNALAEWEREDMTAKLATMLCAFGGLRRSEPLHLWVGDVQSVDGSPMVFLHHPVMAKVRHETRGEMTREEYLRTHCGMEPRNRPGNKFHSGWKGIKCNRDWWAPLYWLPFDGLEDYFWQTFQTYLFEVRPRLMRERFRRGLPDHPFLLVSAGGANHEDDQDSAGAPYTHAAHGRAWTRAIARLARKYANERLVVSKQSGTTLHGLRHLYGGLLSELGLGPQQIQECMHHVSPLSQLTYTKPRNSLIDQCLREGAERIRAGMVADTTSNFRSLGTVLADVRRMARGSL